MAALTRDSFKAPWVTKVTPVSMEEHGFGADSFVWMKQLSAKDLVELRAENGPRPDLGSVAFLYDLLSRTLCSEDGTRLFTSTQDVIDGFLLSVEALRYLADQALVIGGISTAEKN